MLTILYCSECLEKLKENNRLSKIYEIIGEIYGISQKPLDLIMEGNSLLDLNILDDLRILEEKKYIVTTEYNQDYILIKPLGYTQITEDVIRYCPNECHEM